MKKTKNKKPICSEETVQSQSPWYEGGEGLWRERFVKEAGFKPAVKDWVSYGWWEWWVGRVRRCARSRNRQVRDRGTGMRLMLLRHKETVLLVSRSTTHEETTSGDCSVFCRCLFYVYPVLILFISCCFYYVSRESQTTRNVLWSRASVCVCASVCPRPHAHTIARTGM